MVPVERLIDVHPIGVQSFQQRFPGKRKHADDDVPQPASWRCNLTGLSQKHNLYFVAYGDDIHVYTPTFPTQHLDEPVLIIPYSPTEYGLPGYIDQFHPGFINNLLVADFGLEEVIATVRDNGDVHATLVRHVVHAIQARLGTSTGTTAHEIKAFFRSNVGMSAWGLAIHAQARLIAVSSNSKAVTVYRFGLVENDSRNQDVAVSIHNGYANIPCIAFCNTGDDPDGRWLLTTDIKGDYSIIDLRDTRVVQQFRFASDPPTSIASYDRVHAGWSIMFLDSRSFSKQETKVAATGLCAHDDTIIPGGHGVGAHVWDISRTTSLVSDASHAFFRHEPSLPALDHSGRRRALSPRSNTSTELSDVDMDIYQEVSVVGYEDASEGEGSEDNENESNLRPTSGANLMSNYPRFYSDDSGARPDGKLPCPILCAGVRNIYLLQPRTLHQDPFVGLTSALRQPIQVQYHDLDMFERLNMSAYIPQLGIAIMASQKGRAMILALTKVDNLQAGIASRAGKSSFAMKIEAILPFETQEHLNQRPFVPLHGIAVGPMQGSERLLDSRKRWRLMLMYHDHTVLSYEICRNQQGLVLVV